MREDWNRFRLITTASQEYTLHGEIERILDNMGTKVRVISLAPLSQGVALLTRMIGSLRDEFTSNKEFGLNSNLSTNIRHGYVLRELRSPLLSRNLITNKNSDSGDYVTNQYWVDRLLTSDPNMKSQLSAILNVFSAEIDDEITILNSEFLQIRSDKTSQGLFEYEGVERILAAIGSTPSKSETYEEFITEVFAFLWRVTEANLFQVRGQLGTKVLRTFSDSIGSLEAKLRWAGFAQSVPGLFAAITLGRQDMRTAVERVASWCTLSSNSEYQDCDLEIAYGAALSSVRTYYSNINIESYYASRPVALVLLGWCLPILARLFFLILDNAAFHGTNESGYLRIATVVELDGDGSLSLKVSNALPAGFDPTQLALKIENLNATYGKEKARDMVGQEGGSGYPKIWKLLNLILGADILSAWHKRSLSSL
jgi:hypothetical protein